MSTVGSQLISELGKRQQLGMYFDFGAYRRLRKVKTLSELAIFIKKEGFRCPDKPRDVIIVADALEGHANDMQGSAATWACVLSDPTGVLGLLFLPIWLFGRLFDRT